MYEPTIRQTRNKRQTQPLPQPHDPQHGWGCFNFRASGEQKAAENKKVAVLPPQVKNFDFG